MVFLDTEEVAFLMINNDDEKLEEKLDGIRKQKQKFVCLNDNLNHTHPETPKIKTMLFDFYSSLFPLPSSFELPPGQYNQHLYIDFYRKEKSFSFNFTQLFSYSFLLFISFLISKLIYIKFSK